MRIDIHHYLHLDVGPLGGIERLLTLILSKGNIMSAQLDKLTTEVAETKTVAASAVTLIEGLAQQIRDIKDDPVALEALGLRQYAAGRSSARVISAP